MIFAETSYAFLMVPFTAPNNVLGSQIFFLMWDEMGKKKNHNKNKTPHFYGGLNFFWSSFKKLQFIFIQQVGMIPAIYWRNLLRFTTFFKKKDQ